MWPLASDLALWVKHINTVALLLAHGSTGHRHSPVATQPIRKQNCLIVNELLLSRERNPGASHRPAVAKLQSGMSANGAPVVSEEPVTPVQGQTADGTPENRPIARLKVTSSLELEEASQSPHDSPFFIIGSGQYRCAIYISGLFH